MEKIAIWPDGYWCEPSEVDYEIRTGRSDDFKIIEVEFDDEGEPMLGEGLC
jgi:hypothetical protein